MKKFIYSAAAMALAFFAASCQQENLEPVVKANTVTYTVQVADAVATKAIGDDIAAVNELVYEVYRTVDEEETDFTDVDNLLYHKTAEIKNGTATIELEFVNDQNFTVLFWAQTKGNGVYNVNDLTNVTITSPDVANNVNAQAFAGHDFVRDCVSDALGKVTLRRPVSQLNIATTPESLVFEAETGESGSTIALEGSSVKVTGLYTSYNVATGAAFGGTATEYEYTETAVPTDVLTVNGVDYTYVAMNYVGFAPNAGTADVTVSYVINTSEGDIDNEIGNVPVKPNYRTNIVGNLITSKSDYVITLDADFHAGEYVVEGGVNSISVSSAEELVTVFEEIANGDIDTEEFEITLGGDIDLNDLVVTRAATSSNWTPVGTSENPFTGVFDGNGYSIKNLTLVESEPKEGKAYIGFFGYAENATIKNVTFENVSINIPCLDIDHSQGHIGAVAGSLEGTSTIENVTVKGDIQIYTTQDANGASRVAVVAGGNAYGNVTMTNVHVIANAGSYLIANNNVGALAGQLQGKMVFENCSSNINVTANKFFAGGLVGIAAGDSYIKNCHTTGDVAVVAGRENRHNDEYRVGGIAGGWADGKTKVCTLENCSYTGNVSGKNSDGSLAEPLDYMGYVGRGYTLTNCEGSKVIIDGLEFVQVGNTAPYGIYAVNGVESPAIVTNADELNAALNNADVTNILLVNGDFGTIVAKSNKTIVGTESANVDCVNLCGADNVTLKNIEFDAAKATPSGDYNGKYQLYANIVTGVYQDPNPAKKGAQNLVIDGCTFTGSFKSGKPGASIAFTDFGRVSGASGNITIKNCEFDTESDFGGYDIYGYYVGNGANGNGDFVIEKNTFNSSRPNGLPVYLGKYASSTPVEVNGNAFETVATLEDAVYVQDHSSYGVSIAASNNTFAN